MKQSIYISGASEQEVGMKIINYLNVFEKLIIQIDFKSFNNTFERLGIVFECFIKKGTSKKIQRSKTKTLELYLILDYERIMQGTDPENLQHVKEVFLKGCETFLKPLKDFKWNEFEEQLKQIL